MRPPEPRNFDAFPTLISSFDLKGHECEKTAIEMIETWEQTGDHSLVHKGQSSYITGDEMFLNDKRLINLWKTIQECCDVYCGETGIDYTLISTSWFNRLEEYGSVDPHKHERSVISGAYYPKCDNGSAPLMFESPLQPYAMNMNFIKQTKFNTYTEIFTPADGLLILFPSWLKHSVPPNQSSNRYTVSFNTIRHADRGYMKTVKDYRMERHESDNT
ncbi:MAG: hypothetical protein CMA31_01130 [Euryarchaeota archaeon]|nr:hypothetical protein [Euryarchaeota archaeon]|tara:strand:- start:233 stop:883 length:651 start_codon:yes stop_codon:yes gene_type:complete